MKSKLTLLSVLLLLAVFSFGQDEVIKNQEKSSELRVTNPKKKSNSIHQKTGHVWETQFAKRNARMAAQSGSRVVKQALDSLVAEEYDEGSGQWFPEGKQVFTYNFNGKLTLDIYYFWDGMQWSPDFKEEYTYAANSTMTENVSYFWNSVNWEENSKYEYTYNTLNNVTSEVAFYWMSGSQWEAMFKTDYTYDGNNKLIAEISSDWDGSQWIMTNKTEYTYDANGNITLEMVYYYTGSQWEANGKYEYSYDAFNNLILSITAYWDGTQWVLNQKGEYTYDSNGNQILEINLYWDGSQWVSWYKYEITFDANGNVTEEKGWEWDGMQWMETYKDELTYNNMYSFNDLILPSFFEEDNIYFNHMMTQFEEFEKDTATGNWISYFKASLYYSAMNVNSVSDIEGANISVYPNPVTNQINVTFSGTNSTAQFDLFDLQGRLLMSKRVASREQIDLGHLNIGMYFYNLVLGDETHTGKLIKE